MNITEAFASLIPEVADQYARVIRATFDRYVEAYGPHLQGIDRAYRDARFWSELRGYCDRPQDQAWPFKSHPWILNEERLAKGAREYAEAAVAEFSAKIARKVAGIEGAEFIRHSRGVAEFAIVGERNGRKVVIDQQIVLKVSSKGKPFAQFPARIYVDGKFTPEARYEAAFA